jgi:hypothetical protein
MVPRVCGEVRSTGAGPDPRAGAGRGGGRRRPSARIGGDGGESNSPSRNLRRRPLRACPIVCRRTLGRPSATCRALQSRSLARLPSPSGFSSDYATLLGTAPPLNDASAAHGGEAVSTFTLLPKQRGRKQTGCCQLLRLGSFLRGLETNLDSRSPVTGPCRNHASPQRLVTEFSPRCGARGLYSAPAAGQIGGGFRGSAWACERWPCAASARARGSSRRWRAPSRGANRGRRCRCGGRAAVCPAPGRSLAWLDRAS